ncbi:MAG: Crp/Fnr family transcriptional regulator [Gammaproteobacteria bacterium]|nr:Crp/Fnr family transcriptional regulator [Gammaproteobacteria bacterium]
MPDSPQHADVFLAAFDRAETRELAPGDVLIAAGSPADHVFNILGGTLMLSRTGRDGRRQVLSFLFRDHFVGLTTTDRYYFTVEAVTAAKVACCSRVAFDAHLSRNPGAERAFLHMTFRVLEDMLDALYSLGQRTALERLAVFLLYLRHARRLAEGLPDSDRSLAEVALPMTREDIADFLGLQKETVSRSFAQLEERGLIQRAENHRITVRNLPGLRELAGVVDFASPRRLVRP